MRTVRPTLGWDTALNGISVLFTPRDDRGRERGGTLSLAVGLRTKEAGEIRFGGVAMRRAGADRTTGGGATAIGVDTGAGTTR